MFAINPSENDLEALDNLTDFHVEYDHDKPDYRKVVAVSNLLVTSVNHSIKPHCYY